MTKNWGSLGPAPCTRWRLEKISMYSKIACFAAARVDQRSRYGQLIIMIFVQCLRSVSALVPDLSQSL